MVLVFGLGWSTAVWAGPLKFAGYPKEPYMIQSGPQRGFCVDLLFAAAREAKLPITYQTVPNSRLIILFRRGKIVGEPCVYRQWRSPDDAISLYSEPFFKSENIVLQLNGGKAVNNPLDLAGKTIGTGIGYRYTDGFQAAFEQKLMIREDVSQPYQNIRKLLNGRVDAAIVDRHTARFWIHRLGLDPQQFEIAYIFKEKSDLALRMHRDFAVQLGQMKAALDALRQRGEIADIISQYLAILPKFALAEDRTLPAVTREKSPTNRSQ